MRNNMLRNKSSFVRGSIMVVLLLTLFTMMSFTAFAYDQSRQGSGSHTVSSLGNVPTGRAYLSWNPQSKALSAYLYLNGLQPRSNHAAYIHAGTCSMAGKILYPLKNVVADTSGRATSASTISNVTGGIPVRSWAIMVHSGPTARTSDLLCGNVVNPQRATSVTVPLSATHPMH
jgi:ABC-type transport system involved in cytochrome c biogenesis permease subunit